ncbi:cytochrome c oxidase subunit 3 [Schleiferia thermophila]|uniref:Cytochrome c oxidase subunit 3 n=1 Tax=Schleiferia thermophila TaxID=884107 RepID=A0A369A633_9FLAO|nr:cytochrome c oxidase subunit 3 [Schleiferia thermophila]RCX03796.1 cytochrome c oxidase subunit 3 [Schleiferia thermophila]GCD80029.1 cytochrome oxidase subunit III [Schleiferia thermophila]
MATQTITSEQNKNVWGGGNEPFGASYGKLMMWFFLLSDALTFSGFLTAYGLIRFRFSDVWPVPESVFTHFPGLEGDHPLLYVALMTFILIMSSVTMVLAVNAGHHMKKDKVTLWLLLTIVGGFIFLGSQAWEWYHFIKGEHGSVKVENHVYYIADENGHRVSLAQLVHGIEHAHHGDHHEKFTDSQVISAFLANKDMRLKDPGKVGKTYSRSESESLIKKSSVVQGANLKENEYGHTLFANFFFFITGFHGFHVFSGVVINIVIFANVLLGTYERRGHYEMVEKVGLYWHFVDLVWVFVFTFFYLV